jgi:hypothetical protein
MPANYVLLEKITVGAAGASGVTFSSIPQTGYTDLVVKVSSRTTRTAGAVDYVKMYFNGLTTNGTTLALWGDGTAYSGTDTKIIGSTSNNQNTASTFGSADFYIPNYTSSNFKSVSIDAVSENNSATTGDYNLEIGAGLWSSTAAITSITLESGFGNNWVANSTFYLYGVAKLGTTPAIVPYATGGDTIMTDGTYWYHAFRSSGTFTPAKALSADVLVVAGGGGAYYGYGGGGGAGGLRSLASQSFPVNSYTCSIGAGSAGGTFGGAATVRGTNSTISATGFTTITATGGGGGGSNEASATVTGGSGGGAGGSGTTNFTGSAGNAGSFSPVEGYAGGNSTASVGTYVGASGGGGGAGAVGGNGDVNTLAVGGVGATSATLNAMATATATGQLVSGNYYYAGGGGGGAYSTTFGAGTVGGAGGSGGGGRGGINQSSTAGVSGTINTGGGGGAGGGPNPDGIGGSGGSGIIIIRYAV